MKEIFFAAFFSLVRLSFSIKDKFFRQKLIKKIKDLFDFFLEEEQAYNVAQLDFTTFKDVAKSSDIVQHRNNVAQCRSDKLEKSIDEIFELTEILLYLKIVSLSPTLLAQKNILRLRFASIQNFSPNSVEGVKNSEHLKEANHLQKSTKKRLNSKYQNLETEILQIFKDNPGGLSLKEIIPCLQSSCSRRTLQRHLNKMITGRRLLKRGTNNSAKYLPL
ncbi:MAG: hypothetical protein Q8R55_01260 [Candidatus Taylorbacteria bacterium]|nr:hypothetical protein [Candidatus Taylorbacteria bacterium]